VKIEQEFSMRARCRLVLRGGRCRPGCVMVRSLRFAAVRFRKMLPRAGDREALFIEQPLDFEDGFDVFAAVEPVAAGALHRLERRKLGLPVAQDERLRRRQAAHFADAEQALFRNFSRRLSGTRHVLSVS